MLYKPVYFLTQDSPEYQNELLVMKAVVAVLIFALVAVASAAPDVEQKTYTHGNGKPGCSTAGELGIKWRNNWDPIRYWVCQNGQAVSYICPTEYMFSWDSQCCIRWNFWVWTAPFDPPTLASS